MVLANNVREYAIKQGLLCKRDRLLVAVSGGPDSAALLNLLCELKDDLDLHMEVAHLQHGLRGEDAIEDARFVAGLAEKLKLTFHLKEIDLPRMKFDAGKGNLEALARAERYRFFAEVVRKRNLTKVATAHTQDDQAETLLMWMLRGAGMKGMGAMSPRQQLRMVSGDTPESLTVIRPLFAVSKAEILDYLKARNLVYRIDRSNQDLTLLRNWLRLDLLPKIQQRVGGEVSARLSHLAELFRDEDALLHDLTLRSYDMVRNGKDLRRRALLGEPPALQRRILRHWIEQARGHLRGLDFVHIEALLRLIGAGPPQRRLSIPGGWELVREYEALRLEKRSRRSKRVCYDYPFEIGATLRVAKAGIEFHSECLARNPDRFPADLMEAVFDITGLTGSLRVRNFRHGDRFQPLGMAGRKKIKDLFIENKVPLSIRARWPLLTMGHEILWVPGYGRSGIARVHEKSAFVVRIKAIAIET
jgi:tRNA(Ile)-lysidine synthase